MKHKLHICKTVAPEDLRRGDYVTPLYVMIEFVNWLAMDTEYKPLEKQRVRWLPPHGGKPARVLEVCLPFVLVETPSGEHKTFDVRRYQLVRLSKRYGRTVFDRHQRKRKASWDAPTKY